MCFGNKIAQCDFFASLDSVRRKPEMLQSQTFRISWHVCRPDLRTIGKFLHDPTACAALRLSLHYTFLRLLADRDQSRHSVSVILQSSPLLVFCSAWAGMYCVFSALHLRWSRSHFGLGVVVLARTLQPLTALSVRSCFGYVCVLGVLVL